MGIWVHERQEEERDVVLPGNASEGRQIDQCQQVLVSVRPVRYQKLIRIHDVMYIPAATGLKLLAVCGRVRGSTHKITLQNPNPPLTALRNFSLD